MSNDLTFRTKQIEEAPQPEAPLKELENDDVTGATKSFEETDEPPRERESELERWEGEHGKYGLELMGIKEVANEWPYKMQFGGIDKYIREEITERGWEPSPKHYQDILAELEEETGTKEIEYLDKMKKLFEYIQVLKKFKDIKKKKEQFRLT